MKVYRKAEIENPAEFKIGDQITVGKYTATCQKVSDEGIALFLMDTYDDEARPMNRTNTNKGGYAASDLRKYLQSEEALADFDEELRARMVPFENGDLLRIPTHAELFAGEDADDYEEIAGEQWPLMKDRRNRLAMRRNQWEWGWLMNRFLDEDEDAFGYVYSLGSAGSAGASGLNGVRRAFLIK